MTARARPPVPTRERILDAALQSFASNGFAGATTKDIARRAKVNEVTLFRLFKTKRALFSAVVTERSPIIPIRESVETSPRSTVEEMLRNNAKTVLSTLRKHKDLYMVLMSDAWRNPKTRSLAYEATIKQGITLIAEMLSKLMDAGQIRRMDPEIAARALMGTVQFHFLTTDLLGEGEAKAEDEDRVINGLITVLLEGLEADGGGGQR